MRRSNRPFEYIVYTDLPSYRYGNSRHCLVRTTRIPRGKHYRDMVDTLPPTVGKLAVVSAYTAADARLAAARLRGVRCGSSRSR
jgi:hypothetical protein